MNSGTFVARARWSGACLAATVLAWCLGVLPVQAQVITTLPGSYPGAQFLALDAEGTLFATANHPLLSGTPRQQGGTYGSPASFGSGVFISTEGVAIDGNGNIFVVDNAQSAIFEASAPYTTFTKIVQLPGSTVLTGIALDANDNVFFTDFHNSKIYELPAAAYANGITATSATLLYSGTGANGFADVALDPAGNVYVTDDEGGQILKLAAGTFTPSTVFIGGLPTPTGIAIDSSGNIYFTDAETASVNEIVAPAYTNVVTLAASANFSNPIGVGLDASGNIFVADFQLGVVKEIMAPPAVSAVSPNAGPLAGGTTVTITGTNLTGATGVSFGGTAATNVHVVSATQVTATSPAGNAPGPVDVQVTTPNGTSPTLAADQFTYGTLPSVSSVQPTSGPTTGGNAVTINGANFSGATSVQFGGNAAAFSVVSDMQITATAPPGSAGTIPVSVTTVGGSSIVDGLYTYVAAPTVSAVSPGSGAAGGGTIVTITGTHLSGESAVLFGINAATNVMVTDSQITATAPAGSGTVDVTVTTVGGTSATSEADAFTYVGQPAVTAISPSVGPTVGGTFVTITGINFSSATSVQFGTTRSVDFSIKGAAQIVASVPLAASVGTVDITVTTPGGTSPTSTADQFTYYVQPPLAPVVTSVSPAQGPAAGGTTVTITGAGFTGAGAVRFGSNAAVSVTLNGDTQLTATSPAGSVAGVVDVTVTTASGTSATSAADKFTYGMTRTWVSGAGNDSNTCDRATPCLTFAAALANVVPGGEIDVLDGGDFGPLTITKSITIDNEMNAVAGASVSGGNAITIQAAATDVINLFGLTLGGSGAVDGILITGAGRVNIENCSIAGFGTAGIAITPASGVVEVRLTKVTSVANAAGIVIQPASGTTAKVAIKESHVDDNLGTGLQADGSGGGVINAAVADSSIAGNAVNGALALGGSGSAVLNLTRDAIAGNGSSGVASSGGGATATIGSSLIVNNSTGVAASGGGALISYGNNQLTGNGSAGSFTATVSLN